jgi:hypothetical protein
LRWLVGLGGQSYFAEPLGDLFAKRWFTDLDDTIERRPGEKITAKRIYRDPMRPSHSHFVKTSGLSSLCFFMVTEPQY